MHYRHQQTRHHNENPRSLSTKSLKPRPDSSCAPRRIRLSNIPERQVLGDYLDALGAPAALEEIACAHDLKSPAERQALRRRLMAMVRDGRLLRKGRNHFAAQSAAAASDRSRERAASPLAGGLVVGEVIGNRKGFGFLRPLDQQDDRVPDRGSDIFLPARQMRSLMHGDRAVVRVVKIGRDGRREGIFVERLESDAPKRVIGRLVHENGVNFVIPHDSRIHRDILIRQGSMPRAGARKRAEAAYVVARIVEPPTRQHPPIGVIEESLGDRNRPDLGNEISIRTHDIPCQWPDDLASELAALPDRVGKRDIEGRLDLRHLDFVTIDGEDAKDFDDAVCCERTPSGWRLWVAIADVGAYVPAGSALDREAMNRGNSVYFPDRVIPMLPEALSNALCSLQPRVDRLCLGCQMLIDEAGRTTRSRFFEGVIRSRARLTYEAVSQVLGDDEGACDPSTSDGVSDDPAPLASMLTRFEQAYRALRSAREKRGAIDFDSEEIRIVFDGEGRIEGLRPLARGLSHRMIEEAMIAANVAAARFIERRRLPSLFRVHDGPSPDKVEELRIFLEDFGLQLAGGESPEPHHFAELVRQSQDRPDADLIQTVLLRSLSQATYTPDNRGHFGLAHRAYLHFTSPIRRYPDLVVHRAIRHVLRGGKPGASGHDRGSLGAIGSHCSMTERRAEEAVRDAAAWLKCELMRDKIGKTFDALITGVASFGLFVTPNEIPVEGLVPIGALGDGDIRFDPIRRRLEGARPQRLYRLGDRLSVEVVEVDLDERRVLYEPSRRRRRSPGGASAGGGGRKAKRDSKAKGRWRKKP